MSNNYFDLLNVGSDNPPFIETGIVDPRARYYFYRQTNQSPTGSNLPCANESGYDYCYVGNGYWGRDHADEAGLPADTDSRTTFGIYPVGGAFDANLYQDTEYTNEYNIKGEGIFPLLLSSQIAFMLAENSLTLGVSGSPIAYLEQGIRLSMDKVRNFTEDALTNRPNSTTNYAMTSEDINDYVERVLNEYSSSSNNEKLTIIAREFHIASFGNAIETYNLYRRTGKPDLQSPNLSISVPFPRLWNYPDGIVASNTNINQQSMTDQTFWDNNPGGFID
jgi:hypothetical protein